MVLLPIFSVQAVVARVAVKLVLTSATVYLVIPATTVNSVSATVSTQHVGPIFAEYLIGPLKAADGVRLMRAAKYVGPVRPAYVLGERPGGYQSHEQRHQRAYQHQLPHSCLPPWLAGRVLAPIPTPAFPCTTLYREGGRAAPPAGAPGRSVAKLGA